jgi:hypothetical protein
MRRTMLVVAPLLAWMLWAALTLPPAAQVLGAPPTGTWPTVRGAYHVHSRASDGTGTVDQIARASAAAGLQFVIITDHGNATATTAAPHYVAGVLCIVAVEISTTDGHYAALGLAPPPYPLAGEGRDVAQDVARLGGFGIAAHPDSAKDTLQWRAWDVPVDGVEWFNADSQWRDESRWRLLPAILQYPVRPAETVVSLFDRPVAALAQWDRLTASRRVVGLAAADAHARMGLRGKADPYDESLHVPLPSYESVFRAFSMRVEIEAPLSGDATRDAPLLLDAIRAGRVYAAFDGVAGPAVIDFTASSGGDRVRQGGWLRGGDVRFQATANVPPGGSLVLLHNGVDVAHSNGPILMHRSERPGAYRLEARIPGAPGAPPLPWVVSNPIYVGAAYASPGPHADGHPASQDPDWMTGLWHIEKDPGSTGAFRDMETADSAGREFSFQLASGGTSPFVALVTDDAGGVREAARLSFRARASRPMRISVQARSNGGDGEARRWLRSVYLDATPREITVELNDMRVAGTGARTPIATGAMTSILFVYDTTNARPGDGGRIWIEHLRTGAGRQGSVRSGR